MRTGRFGELSSSGRCHRGRDRMVVAITITCVISVSDRKSQREADISVIPDRALAAARESHQLNE